MPTIDELLRPGMRKKPVIERLMAPEDPSWYRDDGSKKGMGFLGMLLNSNNQPMSEYSVGVNIDGKEMDVPSFVPTLNPQEVTHLLNGGEMTDAIVSKAADHARMRIKRGQPIFATQGVDY